MNTNEMPNHFISFTRGHWDSLGNHSNSDIFMCEDKNFMYEDMFSCKSSAGISFMYI